MRITEPYHGSTAEPVADTGAVSHRYYIRDYLGSTRVVLDDAGHVLQATGYYPSGLPCKPLEYLDNITNDRR